MQLGCNIAFFLRKIISLLAFGTVYYIYIIREIVDLSRYRLDAFMLGTSIRESDANQGQVCG